MKLNSTSSDQAQLAASQIRELFSPIIDRFQEKGPSPSHNLWRELVDLQNDVCSVATAAIQDEGQPES
jgi:hypothetical protein